MTLSLSMPSGDFSSNSRAARDPVSSVSSRLASKRDRDMDKAFEVNDASKAMNSAGVFWKFKRFSGSACRESAPSWLSGPVV